MKRDAVDLYHVREAHQGIHDRLINWARWVRPRGGVGDVLPMFVGYRPNGYHEVQARVPVDSLDGLRIERLVVRLPDKHRTVLQWFYVRPYIPVRKVRQALGLTFDDLHELIHDARSMLKNTDGPEKACALPGFCDNRAT